MKLQRSLIASLEFLSLSLLASTLMADAAYASPTMLRFEPVGLSAGYSLVVRPEFTVMPNIGAELLSFAVGKDLAPNLGVAAGLDVWQYSLIYYPNGLPFYGNILSAHLLAYRNLASPHGPRGLLYARASANLWVADPKYASLSIGMSRTFSFASAGVELTYVHENFRGPQADWFGLRLTAALGGWYRMGARDADESGDDD